MGTVHQFFDDYMSSSPFFFIFWQHLWHMEVSRARDRIQAADAALCHSCDITRSLTQCTTAGPPYISSLIDILLAIISIQHLDKFLNVINSYISLLTSLAL